MANCKLAPVKTAEASASASKADISSLSEMLAQKWKSGPSAPSGPTAAVRAGEVRSFKITNLDAAQKRIELELA
jgi:small subunit ribosomal protein S1